MLHLNTRFQIFMTSSMGRFKSGYTRQDHKSSKISSSSQLNLSASLLVYVTVYLQFFFAINLHDWFLFYYNVIWDREFYKSA